MPKKTKTTKKSRFGAKPDLATTRRVTRQVVREAKRQKRKAELTTGALQHEFHSAIRDATPLERHLTFPIVGVGASAGGVEACSNLLRATPADTGMAYVIIHHLAPHQESMLPEILSKHTSMPVVKADHLMQVEPNHVYVIPPNRSLGIVHGALRLMPRIEEKHQHMPIDFFFRCLSEDQRSNAIGVVLSGGDGDGTQGLRFIKSEGGITFAQDPATAQVPAMPETAVLNKVVDYVLPVEGIGEELARIGQNPYMNTGPATTEALPDDEKAIGQLFRLLRGRLGVDFSLYKKPTLQRRLKRRMLLHKFSDLTAYLELLKNDPGEVEALFEDLLINVTSFFRDSAVFETLKSSTFPKLLKKRDVDNPVRIWVPGCATGEEAYSLAMCLLETFSDLGVHYPVQVFATDLSDSAVQRARTGFYPEDIKTDVTPERLRRFFTKSDGGYVVARAIRDMCVFAKHDVTRDPPFSRLDFISCRNLLIYLGPQLQKHVLQIFAYAISPGGFLLLGPSETASATGDTFSVVDKKQKIYVRRATAAKAHIDVNPTRLPLTLPDVDRRTSRKQEPSWTLEVANEVNRLIVEKYNPACVVINEDFHIVQFIGKTTPYLEFPTGEATLDLLKMAKNDLQIELRGLLRKAKSAVAPLLQREVMFHSNGTKAEVDVEIRPLNVPNVGRFYLVFFEEPSRRGPKPVAAKGGKAAKDSQTVARLKQELAATTEYLKSSLRELEVANEELQSANEEILSSNEELQSTNEELETAKEELQSSNEELTTVNEELATRNTQLSLANDDLKNLLASVNIPIVMVGNDLKVRKITPQSEKLLNLIPTDVGRPITDIKPNFELPNLKELIVETIDTMATTVASIADREGRNYSLRIRPYRTSENKIDGAVLIFVDLDPVKKKPD